MTTIRITVGGDDIAGELDDGATAQDLASLLPLALVLADFHEQEKLTSLPRPLSTQGAPRASGASPGDIGYYAPTQHLVLYYAEVGPFPGIVPIGRFDAAAIEAVRLLPDGSPAVVALA